MVHDRQEPKADLPCLQDIRRQPEIHQGQMQMSTELKSLKAQYKFDKWNLYFGDEEINKCKGIFVLYVVNDSATFDNWIQEENEKSVFTSGYFRCEWR